MQHRQEDGPLHIKAKLPIFQEIADNLADPHLLPETLKNNGGADLLGCCPDVGIIPGRENHYNLLGKSGEGTNDGFDAATCLQLIHPADGGDDALGDLFPLAAVFDKLEVFITARLFDTCKHGGLLKGHPINAHNNFICQALNE